MNALKKLLIGSCTLALLFSVAPGARASAWDQKVVATFSGPVEIPGRVLPAGTYVIKMLDAMDFPKVVRITNADESVVLATAFTIDRYRSTPTSNAVFVMQERGINSPQALQAWYYPGYVDGHQLVYGPARNFAATSANSAPVPQPPAAEPAVPAESPVASADTNSTEPASEPAPAADTDQAQSTQTQTSQTASSTDTNATQANNELPKTASTTPLIGLMGMLLVGAAVGLKVLASRA